MYVMGFERKDRRKTTGNRWLHFGNMHDIYDRFGLSQKIHNTQSHTHYSNNSLLEEVQN